MMDPLDNNRSPDDSKRGGDEPLGELKPPKGTEMHMSREEESDRVYEERLAELGLGLRPDPFDFSQRDPWVQEMAPPVDREAVRRYVTDPFQLSDAEMKWINGMFRKWETWHKARMEEIRKLLAHPEEPL